MCSTHTRWAQCGSAFFVACMYTGVDSKHRKVCHFSQKGKFWSFLVGKQIKIPRQKKLPLHRNLQEKYFFWKTIQSDTLWDCVRWLWLKYLFQTNGCRYLNTCYDCVYYYAVQIDLDLSVMREVQNILLTFFLQALLSDISIIIKVL